MSATLLEKTIVYPDSDGEPMAENTAQADDMVFLKTNLDDLYRNEPNVFVAIDLLWYPVQGHPEIRVAPDVFLAFDRPKGYRGSYIQRQEADTPPHVVFEIISPGNRLGEMDRKMNFYDRYGVEEYYTYDPLKFTFSGWYRPAPGEKLRLVHPVEDWISPRMGLRFDAPGNRPWKIYGPNGMAFRAPQIIRDNLIVAERGRQVAERNRQAAERDRQIAERNWQAAERERQIAERGRQEVERQLKAAESELQAKDNERNRLAAKLRELGIDPADL